MADNSLRPLFDKCIRTVNPLSSRVARISGAFLDPCLLGAAFGCNQNQLAQRRGGAEKSRIETHFELRVPASLREI
jgi:hypothetical protein